MHFLKYHHYNILLFYKLKEEKQKLKEEKIKCKEYEKKLKLQMFHKDIIIFNSLQIIIYAALQYFLKKE